jgi:adenosylhomocysteine nucleosidase
MILRSLVTAWLQNAARSKIHEQMADAVRRQVRPGADDSESAAVRQRPCDVGIVFALGIELGGMEDRLDGAVVTQGGGFVARQGGLKGRHVVLLESGVGREAARRGTEALLAGHRPSWVVSAGFAGGLQAQVKKNDIVMANSVADLEGRRLAIDLKMSPEALAAVPGLHVGRLLTIDRVIHRPDEKRHLGQEHGALAVDMESSAVAEVCGQTGTRFLAVRIVTDAMDDALPADVERLLRPGTAARRVGAALGAVFNRPSSVKDMLKLKEDALVASDRLAKFLAGVIVQLAPATPVGTSPGHEK